MQPDEFLQLPYARRQLILFLPDTIVNHVREVAPNRTDLELAKMRLGMTLWPMSAGTQATLEAYIVAHARRVDVLLVSEGWAGPIINVPPAHPRPRVLYAGHPATPHIYLPFFDFHRFLFEHKFAELVSILMHLGATKIRVKQESGWGKNFSAKLAVGLPQAHVDLGANAERSDSTASQLLYEAELTGTSTPTLPENLVWYPYEATWKPAVEGRLKFGLKSFSLSLDYRDDYGVTLDLKIKVEKSGLDAGGSFQQHVATKWLLEGEFRPVAP